MGSTTNNRSLMGQAAHGFAWVFAWRITTRVMGVGSTLVLVRLLAPAEFGLVALALSFIGSIDLFSQIGVEEALVRMPSPKRATYDTAFTMIFLRCALISLITAAASEPVALFFNEPRLVGIMLSIAAVTLLAGLENVGVQDFRRDMRFDKEFTLQALPRFAGIITTVAAAFLLRDYRALIIGTAITRIGRVLMSYMVHPFRPSFTLAAWRDLVGFSLWTWSICVARVLREQPATFIIGRILGPASVGMLTIGGEIALLPATELVAPMGRSMFSAFALARRTQGDVEDIFRRLTGMTAIITIPASFGLALVASPLVALMLGPSWMNAVPLMQILAVCGAFNVLGHACHAQFDAFSRLRHDFLAILATGILRIACVAALVLTWRLMGAVAGIGISIVLEPVIYLFLKSRILPYRPRELLAVVIRPTLAAMGMAGCVILLDPGADVLALDTMGLVLRLLEGGSIGVVSYTIILTGLWWISGRPQGVEADILNIVAKRLRLPSSARIVTRLLG